MGQRLDRPSSSAVTNGVGGSAVGSSSLTGNISTANNGNAATGAAVSNSMSTTFSSSSSSSASSSSSSSAAQANNPATRNANSRHSNTHIHNNHHHHHRHSNRSTNSGRVPRGSMPEQLTVSGNVSSADLLNMSPRTRFRHEMARRGYTNSSSDLFFRLFQFPSISSNSNNSNASTSTITNNNSNNLTSHLNTNTTPPENAAATNTANTNPLTNTNSMSSGLSRIFGLGGGNSSSSSSHNNHHHHHHHNNNAITGDDLDSELSSDEDEPHWNHNLNSIARSLPFFFGMRDFKCFVCNKLIPADDVETHIMMCLTKPRLTYNDDILTDDKGECIICFEELEKGQTIARLPCLCIYHKNCIDSWLTRSQSCPGHPS